MSRKITIIMIMLISIVSIALVTFFGMEATKRQKVVPVEEIMFVKHRDGDENDRVTKNMTNNKVQEETLEVYYYIYPANATNKNISVIFDGKENCDKISFNSEEEGLIVIDFLGVDFTESSFRVNIASVDGNKTASHTFSFYSY